MLNVSFAIVGCSRVDTLWVEIQSSKWYNSLWPRKTYPPPIRWVSQGHSPQHAQQKYQRKEWIYDVFWSTSGSFEGTADHGWYVRRPAPAWAPREDWWTSIRRGRVSVGGHPSVDGHVRPWAAIHGRARMVGMYMDERGPSASHPPVSITPYDNTSGHAPVNMPGSGHAPVDVSRNKCMPAIKST